MKVYILWQFTHFIDMARRMQVDEDDGRGEVASSSGNAKHKVIVIGSIVGIVLLFIFLMMVRKTASVGQAVYVEQSVAEKDVVPNGVVGKDEVVVWGGFSKATAAKDDVVTIPLYLISASGQEVTAIDMNVGYDKNMLSIEPVDVANALPSGEWIGKPIEIAQDISSGKQVSLMSNGGMKNQFASVSFKVKGDYVDKDILSSVTFTMAKVTGIDSATGVKFVAGVKNPVITTIIVIVPKCVDNDNDGYGAKGTDRRACNKVGDKKLIFSNKDGIPFDCNDDPNKYGGQMAPDLQESCDGLDNNCDGKVDDGLTGGWNDNLNGVCLGKKLCAPDVIGKEGWKNSYEVKDATKNIIMFSDNFGKSYSQLDLYESAAESKCDFFDNNCDGVVNDGLPNCKIGGEGGNVPKGLLPTGNVFLTYGGDDDFAEQKIDNLDVSLLYVLKDARDAAEPLGDVGKAPFMSKVKGTLVWVCDSGMYYVFVNGKYEKHWYKGKKEAKSKMNVNKGKLVEDGQELMC